MTDTVSVDRLVGRDAELTGINNVLGVAAEGQLRVCLMLGDPGSGKSHLLREIEDNAGPAFTSIAARATSFERTTPFAVWISALDRYFRDLEPAAREQIARRTPSLSPLIRSLRSERFDRQKGDHVAITEELADAVAMIAMPKPLLVLLDDLHLAGAPSWEGLYHLAESESSARVALVVTARSAELGDHPIAADVVHTLEQDGVLTRFDLKPFSDEDLADLARYHLGIDEPPQRLVDWLSKLSQGIPLFATGLLRALVDIGGDPAQPALSEIPPELRERVLRRLRDLSPLSTNTLRYLAVIDEPAGVGELAGVAGQGRDQTAVALDDLNRHGLIAHRYKGVQPLFEVAHPLIRDIIYDEIGVAQRGAMHGSIGRALLAMGRPTGAEHLARSSAQGDETPIHVLIDALKATETQGQYRECAAIVAALVGVLPEGDRRWLDVLAVMDPHAEWLYAHLVEDHLPDFITAMHRIEALVDPDSDLLGAAVTQFRIACLTLLSRDGGGGRVDALARSQTLFTAAGDETMALTAQAEEGGYLTHNGDPRRGAELLETIVSESAHLSDPRPMLHALAALTWSQEFLGDLGSSLAAAQRGCDVASSTGNRYRRSHFLQRQSSVLARMGHLTEAVETHARAAQDAVFARDALVHEAGVLVHWLAGDLRAAREWAHRSAARNRVAVSVRQAAALALGGRCSIEAGELDDTSGFIDSSLEALEGNRGPWGLYPGWAAGIREWNNGSEQSIGTLRTAAERGLDLAGLPETSWILLDLAEAATDLSDQSTAEWAGDISRSLAVQFPHPMYSALLAVVQLLGGLDRGVEQMIRGVEDRVIQLEEVGATLFAGRGLLALAKAKAALGDDPS